MLCIRPYRTEVADFGCGRCMPCLINRRRTWTTRLMIESYQHTDSVFATLTYAHDRESLEPAHLQEFMKVLRKQYEFPIRYYGVGEYGDLYLRPHYHVALFGVSIADYEQVYKAWKWGFIHLGNLEHKSAQYIAGYMLKKLGHQATEGKHKEFSRMSLRPGIGQKGTVDMSKELLKRHFLLSSMEDVPNEVRVDGKKMPIGRYLKKNLRVAIGRQPLAPQELLQRMKQEKAEMPQEEKDRIEGQREAQYQSAIAKVKIASSKKVF